MRSMPDALLATNEELLTLSGKPRDLNSTSINLDPSTRDRIIIRPSAKSYVLKRKAAAAQVGENRDKLSCFTSTASDSLPVTPTTTAPERVPQAKCTVSTLESARRRHLESRVENTPPSPPMAHTINKTDAAAPAQKKRHVRIFEGRIEKRKTSPRFRPILKPVAQPLVAPPEHQAAPSPPPSLTKLESCTPSCNCHQGFECRVCRVRKLTQSFSSIITMQCELWKTSSMLPAVAT